MKRSIRILVSMAVCVMTTLTAWAQTERTDAKVRISGEDFYVHSVKQGDTFYSLGKVYNVADTVIIRHNPLTAEGLKVGQVIKIPVQPYAEAPQPASVLKPAPRKGFRQHVVQKGETAYSISRLYGIPLATLIDDNQEVDPLHLPEGCYLHIRKKEQGDATPEEIKQEWVEYKEAINSVSTDGVYHIVNPGETLFSLSQQYDVPIDSIASANKIVDGALKVLSMIRIPNKVQSQPMFGLDSAQSVNIPQYIISQSEVMSTPISKNQTAEVALLLPLRGNEKSDNNFLDLYQGALIALDDIKQDGLSVNLRVYNTEREQTKVAEIVSKPEMDNVDLLIGPIYNDELLPAQLFAESKNIPLISPLSTINASSEMLFQAAPDPEYKFAKLDSMLLTTNNIVVITSDNDDPELRQEVNNLLQNVTHKKYHFNSATDGGKIVDIIEWSKSNLFVVLAKDEINVDKTLASISSAYNNTSARTSRTASIRVLGSPRWLKYNTLDKNLYFKLGVTFVASYHADRTDSKVRNFDARYIQAFGELPSLYAYKGYDVTKSFVMSLFTPGSSFDDRVNANVNQLLQAPYHYAPKEGSKTHVNTQWTVVNYNPDYTITIK